MGGSENFHGEDKCRTWSIKKFNLGGGIVQPWEPKGESSCRKAGLLLCFVVRIGCELFYVAL